MLEIGLTGGIGAGKSTVAQLLVRRGVVLIDADIIVRELQRPGAAVFLRMVERFGPGILGPTAPSTGRRSRRSCSPTRSSSWR